MSLATLHYEEFMIAGFFSLSVSFTSSVCLCHFLSLSVSCFVFLCICVLLCPFALQFSLCGIFSVSLISCFEKGRSNILSFPVRSQKNETNKQTTKRKQDWASQTVKTRTSVQTNSQTDPALGEPQLKLILHPSLSGDFKAEAPSSVKPGFWSQALWVGICLFL